MNFKPTINNLFEYHYDPRSVAIGHLNSDIWLDIVVSNRAVPSISVYLASGDGTFAQPTIYRTDSHSDPYMVAVGDLNNDQLLDMALANFATNNIEIFMGDGNGSFTSELIISTGSSHPIYIHLVDLNNDALLDIVTVNYGTNRISILYGQRNGNFSYSIVHSTGYDSLPYSIISGDFNNDNQLDLAVANYGTNDIHILLAKDNGTFFHHKTFSTGINSHPHSIVVGYFNNDLLLDIAVANSGNNSVGVFLSMGNGTFTNQTIYLLDDASPYAIGVDDFNLDNHVDIVVTNKGTRDVGILLGQGNGSFSKVTTFSTGSSSSISVCLSDLNNDNLPDIAVVNNDINSISILFGYDEGFQDQITTSTGYGSPSLALGDFNNDSRLDVVLNHFDEDSIGVLLGYGRRHFWK